MRKIVLVALVLGGGCVGEPECPDGYGFNGDLDSCYRLVDNDARSWQAAEEACERAGFEGVPAHLAVVGSGQEKVILNDAMRENSTGYWVGVSDHEQDGTFLAVTGDLYEREWGAGEPNNDFNTEDCMEIRVGITDLPNDRTCSDAMNWVCEWDGIAPAEPPTWCDTDSVTDCGFCGNACAPGQQCVSQTCL